MCTDLPARTRARAVIELVEDAKELAGQIHVSLDEALAMLVDDRIQPPAPEAGELGDGDGAADVSSGKLFSYGTIESYVAAVMELYHAQVSARSNNWPNPRTDLVGALIHQRRQDKSRISREAYDDRGGFGYDGGYTAAELRKMQQILLENDRDTVYSLPSHSPSF
jgi:hypothetical protein